MTKLWISGLKSEILSSSLRNRRIRDRGRRMIRIRSKGNRERIGTP